MQFFTGKILYIYTGNIYGDKTLGNYDYSVKGNNISYTVQSGDKLSRFFRAYARKLKEQGVNLNVNDDTAFLAAKMFGKNREKEHKSFNIGQIQAGQKITIDTEEMNNILHSTMGLSLTQTRQAEAPAAAKKDEEKTPPPAPSATNPFVSKPAKLLTPPPAPTVTPPKGISNNTGGQSSSNRPIDNAYQLTFSLPQGGQVRPAPRPVVQARKIEDPFTKSQLLQRFWTNLSPEASKETKYEDADFKILAQKAVLSKYGAQKLGAFCEENAEEIKAAAAKKGVSPEKMTEWINGIINDPHAILDIDFGRKEANKFYKAHYQELMVMAKEKGVDPLLMMAIFTQESGFDPANVTIYNAEAVISNFTGTVERLKGKQAKYDLAGKVLSEFPKKEADLKRALLGEFNLNPDDTRAIKTQTTSLQQQLQDARKTEKAKALTKKETHLWKAAATSTKMSAQDKQQITNRHNEAESATIARKATEEKIKKLQTLLKQYADLKTQFGKATAAKRDNVLSLGEQDKLRVLGDIYKNGGKTRGSLDSYLQKILPNLYGQVDANGLLSIEKKDRKKLQDELYALRQNNALTPAQQDRLNKLQQREDLFIINEFLTASQGIGQLTDDNSITYGNRYAKEYGQQPKALNPFNYRENFIGSIGQIADSMQAYKGRGLSYEDSIKAVLIAYNAGPGRVHISGGQLDKEAIPGETREYIHNIPSIYATFQNRYGIAQTAVKNQIALLNNAEQKADTTYEQYQELSTILDIPDPKVREQKLQEFQDKHNSQPAKSHKRNYSPYIS